jgi:hypothetical protein
LTYAITAGNTGGAFAINASSGQITVANSAALDFETTPSFSLTVQVTDDGSPALSTSAPVTILLTNVNEKPTLTVPAAQAAYEDVGRAITGITVADPEGGGLTVTLSVGKGTLALTRTAGLTVSGDGSASVTLSGSLADLNPALASLVYCGGRNYSGTDTLRVTADDGSLSASGEVAIAVQSASDQAAYLRSRVNEQKAAGVLSKGQANSLTVKLALKGNVGDAGKVQAFLNEVAAYQSAGILPTADAQTLLELGNVLLLSVKRR